jgi:hypothetical protein
MAPNRAVADARLKMLHSQILRGLLLYTLESQAVRAAIRQRRLADARTVRPFSRLARLAAAPR